MKGFIQRSLASVACTLLLALATAAVHARADEPSPAPASRPVTVGFYPLWENTGFVESHRSFFLGTNGAQVGFGNWAQVGVQPINFLYRVPNFNFKFRIPLDSAWSTSVNVGAFYLLEMASRAILSPMYVSRLDNPDYRVMLVPVSFSASRKFADWMTVHQTLTTMGLFASGGIQDSASFGYSAVAEFQALSRHSLNLHLAEVGFWNHDHFMLGASYRWSGPVLELRAGYFYRITPGAAQASPMVGFGWYL